MVVVMESTGDVKLCNVCFVVILKKRTGERAAALDIHFKWRNLVANSEPSHLTHSKFNSRIDILGEGHGIGEHFSHQLPSESKFEKKILTAAILIRNTEMGIYLCLRPHLQYSFFCLSCCFATAYSLLPNILSKHFPFGAELNRPAKHTQKYSYQRNG